MNAHAQMIPHRAYRGGFRTKDAGGQGGQGAGGGDDFTALAKQLETRNREFGEFAEKAAAEVKKHGKALDETTEALKKAREDVSDLAARVLEMEQKGARRPGGEPAIKSLGETVTGSDAFAAFKSAGLRGSQRIEVKAITSAPGSAGALITPDVQRLSDLFTSAGMKAPVLDRIRDEIWLKLWGNVCFNPISALTHATLDVICSNPGTRALSRAIMLEAQAIAESLGVKFRVDVERRIEGARKVGAHKTSMLQDLERGRPVEIDPLITVVQEMGRMTDIATPALDAVLALVAQRTRLAGLYDGAAGAEAQSLAVA